MNVGKISSPPPVSAQSRVAHALQADEPGPSWQSRCLIWLLRRLPIKTQWGSAEAVREKVHRLILRPASYAPTGLGRGVKTSMKTSSAGWPIYTAAPTSRPEAGNIVVFLHGGGYINEIVRAHWRFIGDLTRDARARCVVPIFPLVPHATADELVPAMGELLRDLLTDAGSTRVTVIGNSAGAGLALATAQWLRDAGCRQPDELVLISPAADASVSGAQHREIAAQDPLQDIPGILEAGRIYAGGLDPGHPYVSPLHGDFHGLAPMVVFAGTLDLLYPDSTALAAKAQAAGVPVELYLRQGQPHNYALMPTPEGRQARATILRVVTEGLA